MRARQTGPLLLGLTVALLSGCATGSDNGIFVPVTLEVGSGDSADFRSIQPAVDAAAPGETILVQPGVYVERVIVSKSVSLIGSGPTTLIQYPAGAPGDSAVITIQNVRGVRIEGLSVQASQSDVDGIRVRDATEIVLDSVIASNNRQDGADVRRSSRVEIVSGTFEYNGGDGIQVDEGCQDVSIVSNRAVSNNVDGIKVRSSSYVVVRGNLSTNNDDDGILVAASDHVQVIENESSRNGSWGIHVQSSPDTVLEGNLAENNAAGEIGCEPGPCPSR